MDNGAKILDGKALAAKIRSTLKDEVEALSKKCGRVPSLAVILVGDNPASQVYVRNKANDCKAIGIDGKTILLEADAGQEKLLALLDSLNDDDTVDGILVQLPLPKGYDEKAVIERIKPSKDVDAFHPLNGGNFFKGNGSFLPCTPAGIIQILKEYNIEICGKECVVIGRSNIVGKPMAMMLLDENGTVTICHSKSKNLAEITKRADILVSAVGRADFIKGDMIKDGAVVVDVGMNRVGDKLCGDVCFDECVKKASYITPVPGGVGPMTRAMLMVNTVTAYKSHAF